MTTLETVLKWLNKQRKSKEIALYRATHKNNQSDKEIDDIVAALDVIEYLTEIVEKEGK